MGKILWGWILLSCLVVGGCADFPAFRQILSATPPTPEPVTAPETIRAPETIPDMQADIRQIRRDIDQLMLRLDQLESRISSPAALTSELGSEPTPAAIPNPWISPEVAMMPTVNPTALSTPTAIPTPTEFPSPTPEPTPLQVGTQTITLPGDVLFDFDQATIKPAASDLLRQVATTLKEMPSARIQVVGHTDSIGDPTYNLGLSLRRANAVRDYLSDLLPASPLRSWSTAGYGDGQPIANNQTAAGRQRNRRVELIVAP